MAVEFFNLFDSYTLTKREKDFIASTMKVSGDMLTTLINYLETVKCRVEIGTVKDLDHAIRNFKNIQYFADQKFPDEAIVKYISLAFPEDKPKTDDKPKDETSDAPKPKVHDEVKPFSYNNMKWLHKKSPNPFWGRDTNGKARYLKEVLPEGLDHSTYVKTYAEKVKSIVDVNIDAGNIDLSVLPAKALACMMEVLFIDRVWNSINKKVDDKLKATSFDDGILTLTYKKSTFSFDFKDGNYHLFKQIV